MILALVDDLFFSSKISETARQLNRPLRLVKDRAQTLIELEACPEKLIVDLNAKCNPTEVIREVRQLRPALPIVAFGSHVQTELLQAARDAGCEQVVARSYFSSHLPEILGPALPPT